MLSRLHIRNYVLIDSLEVDFPEGLVIITGQTGAGKSILLGALSLLTGAKADASVISQDADSCVVEAEFTGADDRVRAILDDADVEWDDGRLLVRRLLSRSGRSRSFVNDCPVAVSLLQDISGLLVDIHSQHRSLLLTDKSFQLSVLDSFSGNGELLKECAQSWRRLCAARSEFADLSSKLERLKSEEDFNRSQWERLDSAHLRDGELAELEEEQTTLANAEQIKELFNSFTFILEPDDKDGGRGVVESLKEAGRELGRLSAFVPDVSGLSVRLESARIEIADIIDEAAVLDSRISASPDRLEQVEDRMSLIYSLFNRFSCSSEAGLIAERDRLGQLIFDSSSLYDRLEELERGIADETRTFSSVSSRLREARLSAAPRFSAEIAASLHFLELDRAAFKVAVEESPASSSGTDRVQFLFSSTGTGLQDVAKCASGGEISRIMLCLKALMAKYVGMPTLIFDEIDTGVSGSVADKMGRMICDMGSCMQVFSITHLPQVAAKGDAHYVVSRMQGEDGRAKSGMREVRGRERVFEIARMLSGSTVTEAAVANAETLLKG